jgi:glycosyltransferase involved in cell wall biosynthesis
VLHLVTSVEIGGQEMVILHLARRAMQSGLEVRVMCLHRKGALEARFLEAGVPVDLLPAGALHAVRSLATWLRRWRPHILHTHNPAPNRVGALARLLSPGAGLVHTKHGRNWVAGGERYGLAARLATRFTDIVVAVSRDAAAVAREVEGVPEAKLRVIYNGVDTAAFARVEPDCRASRAVCVARLNPVKDIPTLIAAARIMADRLPGFRLEVIGDGPDRSRVEAAVVAHQLTDCVRLPGFRDDIPGVLAGASLFVLPSLTEGVSLTLLEAMAAGLPVVATAVGGNPEVVMDGVTGTLVPPGSPERLAEAIMAMFADPDRAQAMGEAGRARVREVFSLEAMATGYDRAYRELLSGPPAS